MGTLAAGRRTGSVVWELSEEGKVVVDVDAPVRPFGEVPHTPPRGTEHNDGFGDLGEGAPLDVPKPIAEGKRRTLPPLPAR